jgi:hypothetical protein
MTPLALLALIQELPPPPEPTGSPEIDTVRVIGVVIVSLGVIVLLALAIRPLIVKPHRHKRRRTGDDPSPDAGPEQTAPFGSGSIIQFPKTLVAEGAAGGPGWAETNASIAERFNRVVGETGGRRRKLGDRNPARTSHDLATAALHRMTPEPNPWLFSGTPAIPPAQVMPIQSAERETAPLLRRVEPTPDWMRALTNQPPVRTPVAEIPEEVKPSAAMERTGSVNAVEFAPADDERVAIPSPTENEAILDQQPDVTVTSGNDMVGETKESAVPANGGIDTTSLAALHQVVRDLIYCANAGELLQGFALYSDPYLFRFLDETGMSEEEFRDTFGSIKARPRDAWEHLDRLFDIVVLPAGAIEATASYVNAKGQPTDGLERYRFIEVDGYWMIDDITPLPPRAD